MKNSENKSYYFKARKKSFYGSVAFMALMCASTFSEAMVPEEDMARVSCLWNLGTEAFKASALKVLEKKAFEGDTKRGITYLKKLSEFLQEYENSIHIQDLKILQKYSDKANTSDKPKDLSPLSTFYNNLLESLSKTSSLSKEMREFQILKLKTFYRRLPQTLTKIDSTAFMKDINTSFRALQSSCGLDEILHFKLEYFQKFYNTPNIPIEKLQGIAEEASKAAIGSPPAQAKKLSSLASKITFKLAHKIPVIGIDVKGLTNKQSYYYQSAQLNNSMAKYYLAQLYDTPKYGDMISDFYNVEEAWTSYLKAAKDDNPLAAHELAKILKVGNNDLSIEPNEEQAFKWHDKAAKKGHPISQYELAQYYKNKGDKDKSFKLLQQSADSGYAIAQLELAQAYEKGKIIEKNFNLAVYWYQKAADQKELSAYYPLGYAYEKGQKDYAKAIHYYSKGRKLNDPRSQVRLGKIYLKGKGSNKSVLLSAQCFHEASQRGSADGQYYVGLMKLQGQVFLEQEPKSAIQDLKASADQDYPKALFQYGIMKQFGVEKEEIDAEAKPSYEEAVTYYEKAIKKDNTFALYHLGWLYKNGLITNEKESQNPIISLQKTLELWEKAATLGHIGAAYGVGKLYLNAWVEKKEEGAAKKAEQYLTQASASGHIDSTYLLGVMQENGIGGEINSIEAMKSYEKAAESGHSSALFKLAKFYEMTLDPENKHKAFKYYDRAARQGHVEAGLALGKLYQEEKEESKNLDKAFACFKALDKVVSPSVLSAMKQLAKGGHKEAIAWFEEKALQGNSKAQKYVGKLLEIGVHRPQNMLKAIDFYQQAATQGNRSAQRRLLDFKEAHLFEAFGIKENELSIKVVNKLSESEKINIDLKDPSHEKEVKK